MAIIGVGIAGRMINRQQVLPVAPAIPAIPAAVQALPIIPVVHGNVSFVFCKRKSWFLPGNSSVCNLHRAPNVPLIPTLIRTEYPGKEGKDILPEESEHSSFAWAMGPGNGNVQSQYISNTRATVQGHENESGMHNSVTKHARIFLFKKTFSMGCHFYL